MQRHLRGLYLITDYQHFGVNNNLTLQRTVQLWSEHSFYLSV